mmetsp:Transcript_100743/g.325128  ORF Transcript_100743/g.325128 Transcript_100743/m.325128 type:complete len:275 (+) Transcript_100743:669-1493(+)
MVLSLHAASAALLLARASRLRRAVGTEVGRTAQPWSWPVAWWPRGGQGLSLPTCRRPGPLPRRQALTTAPCARVQQFRAKLAWSSMGWGTWVRLPSSPPCVCHATLLPMPRRWRALRTLAAPARTQPLGRSGMGRVPQKRMGNQPRYSRLVGQCPAPSRQPCSCRARALWTPRSPTWLPRRRADWTRPCCCRHWVAPGGYQRTRRCGRSSPGSVHRPHVGRRPLAKVVRQHRRLRVGHPLAWSTPAWTTTTRVRKLGAWRRPSVTSSVPRSRTR